MARMGRSNDRRLTPEGTSEDYRSLFIEWLQQCYNLQLQDHKMDILFGNLALLTIAVMAVAVFFMYTISAIRRDGAVIYVDWLIQKLKWIGTALASFSGALVGLLATSDDTSDEDDATKGDLTGIYNFRTRKYDNGTDPYGWYEEDL
ncbi:MAG: hypothetical protein C0630_10830 [Sedimenticola selenatireducens]|uniref:Uncharacterized protein n=2 Tax=Sedimenticola selenatireducens TaxID=191960 RepID=A0A2N6CW22_9GAMM|nr:MAG: hypothetical protein C0630_10830 [Sedimenticola selenatireducens]